MFNKKALKPVPQATCLSLSSKHLYSIDNFLHNKKNIIPFILLITFCFLSVMTPNESTAFEYMTPLEHQYRSVKAMGMGNAFGAVANDSDAFFYNPAGIASIKDTRVDLQPMGIIITRDIYEELENIQELIDDMEAINKSSDPLKDPNLEDERLRLMNRMKILTRKKLGVDTASPLRLIVPLSLGKYAIAVGGIAHAWSQSQIQVQQVGLPWDDFAKDLLNDELFYNIIGEISYGGVLALEMPVYPLPLEISGGLSIRRLHRWQLTDKGNPLGLDDLIQMDEDDFKKQYFDPEDPLKSLVESKGYRVDIGTMATFRDAVSVALVFQNVPGKVAKEDIPRNSEISASINLAKLSMPSLTSFDIILAGTVNLDEKFQKDEDILNKGRFGMEAVWRLPFLELSGRAGSNRGFMTLGAGIKLFFLDFDYAFYGDLDTDWHAFSFNLAF